MTQSYLGAVNLLMKDKWISKLSSLRDYNRIRTHNHLVCKQTFNHLTNLAKLLSVHLRNKRLRVQIPLQLLRLQISGMLQVRSSFDIQTTTECRFTLKCVCDMIRTHTQCSDLILQIQKWMVSPNETIIKRWILQINIKKLCIFGKII